MVDSEVHLERSCHGDTPSPVQHNSHRHPFRSFPDGGGTRVAMPPLRDRDRNREARTAWSSPSRLNLKRGPMRDAASATGWTGWRSTSVYNAFLVIPIRLGDLLRLLRSGL